MLTQLMVKEMLFTGYPERSAVDAGYSPAGPHTHPAPPRPHTESPVIPAVQHRRTTAWTWCKGPGITKEIPNRMTGLDVCPVQRILKWKWLILSGRRPALPRTGGRQGRGTRARTWIRRQKGRAEPQLQH